MKIFWKEKMVHNSRNNENGCPFYLPSLMDNFT